MIDTGFTGFLLMPLISAFPLTLTLMGTSSYTLADGTNSPKLLAFGTVTLDNEETHGTIVLEGNHCGMLLGMDFLRKAKRALVVHENGVLLIHEDVVKEFGKLVAASRQAADDAGKSSEAPGVSSKC